MSEHCRNMYNACLNTCPKVGNEANSPQIRPDVARCVDDCNSGAKRCR